MEINNYNQQIGKHCIDGQWQVGQGDTFTSINPAKENLMIWQGQEASSHQVIAAYQAAESAFVNWAKLSFNERSQYVLNFKKIIETRKDELKILIAQESGKPLWEALTEANSVIGKIDISMKAFQERTSDKQISSGEINSYLRYKPHGVVAILGPFNFPAHLSNGHIVPALLAGNTIIYKPSELTPAVAQFIMECWDKAGLPKGVLNCIQGGAKVGIELLKQNIQGVYFTGSFRAGCQINKAFAEKPEVILALEMGGNNSLIIDEVIDIKAAVHHTISSAFITAGQRCSCARRVYIPNNSLGDQFITAFVAASKRIKVGSYEDNPEPFMGPVIRHEHALNHLNAQKKLQSLGGNSLLEMQLLQEKTGLLSPGIMDMSGTNEAFDDEIFAPFVQVYRYDSFEQAITMANNTKYGLVAGLLSDNSDHYHHFYQTIRAGLINWNRPTTGAASNLPFGGIGHSGNHRPSAYFAADYCSYPIASLEQNHLSLPKEPTPGIIL